MEKQLRAELIKSYSNAYAILKEAIAHYPAEMWKFKPSTDVWSIHEIIIHITDSEANSYIRCRRCIAEPGQTVMAYDENSWAVNLDYHSQDTAEALELFKWLRLRSARLIESLPETAWSQSIVHPENGIMTLEDWLKVYERHIPDHVTQMNEVLSSWKARK